MGKNEGRAEEPLRIELHEERPAVRKRARRLGTIRVRKTVGRATERRDVPVTRDAVRVDRVAVNRVVEERREPWEEHGELVVPVYDEELVVVKRLVLREEVRIRLEHHEETQAVEETLRRERLVIEDSDQTGRVDERVRREDAP